MIDFFDLLQIASVKMIFVIQHVFSSFPHRARPPACCAAACRIDTKMQNCGVAQPFFVVYTDTILHNNAAGVFRQEMTVCFYGIFVTGQRTGNVPRRLNGCCCAEAEKRQNGNK